MQQQAEQFLSDGSRNRFANDQISVSSIFNWYRDDFETGWCGADSLAQFLVLYSDALELPKAAQQRLVKGDIEIEFLDYNWKLNDKSRQ